MLKQEKENDGDGGLLIPSYLQHTRDTRMVDAWQASPAYNVPRISCSTVTARHKLGYWR